VYVPNRTINCETLYQVNAPFGVVDYCSKIDMLTRDCGEVSRRASAIHNEMSYCFTEESRDLEESGLNISLENDITSG